MQYPLQHCADWQQVTGSARRITFKAAQQRGRQDADTQQANQRRCEAHGVQQDACTGLHHGPWHAEQDAQQIPVLAPVVGCGLVPPVRGFRLWRCCFLVFVKITFFILLSTTLFCRRHGVSTGRHLERLPPAELFC